MRILFLTNFYQIHGAGGEEQSCQQVVEGLQQRGHTTLVLTSLHGTNNEPVESDGISRSLFLEMDLAPLWNSITFFTSRKVREKHNLQTFERILEQFAPDIVFIWGMWNLPKSLAAYAETKYPEKVVYRFATYWPTLPSQHENYWREPGCKWYSRLPKRVLGHFALAMLAKEAQEHPLTFTHAICVSAAARQVLVEAGIPVTNARIIHTGIDAQPYLNGGQHQPSDDDQGQNLNLLYAGRLAPDKGIETAIMAVAKLVFDQGQKGIRLTVAGLGSPDYQNSLHQLVKHAGLTDFVSFLGWVPPEEMPQLLRQNDVLLLTSTWAEPFSRVVMEGMISGLVVIATAIGGTPEIITDGENGMLFRPGDPEALAQKIYQLVDDPELRSKLANAGIRTITEQFTVKKMMDDIESYLQEVAVISPSEDPGRLSSIRDVVKLSV